MFKSAAVPLVLGLFLVCAPARAQGQNASTQLTQYVRDARKAGLKDAKIQENAEAAGWPPDQITAAMAASNGTGGTPKPPQPGAPGSQPEPSAANEPGTPAKPAAAPIIPPPADDPKDRNAPNAYEIGAGDVLHISVWKEPDASVPSAVVRPDGKISMPLLKEVSVLGLTVEEAEQLIARELAHFLTTPDVTIVVQAINSKKIYITGGVKKEGPMPYTYRMTVLQAITEAGGLTDYAKRKKIYVLHEENGRQFTFSFDYDAVLKGQHVEMNIYLTSGDTIVVPH
jgi:polysaccharide export outer membrane protein